MEYKTVAQTADAMTTDIADIDMAENAEDAARLLGLMANPQRLRILCLMVDNEISVSDIVDETGLAQPTVSQHLKKLRDADVVITRRKAQTIFYKLSEHPAKKVLETLHGIYCT